jgi:hypothetical protein
LVVFSISLFLIGVATTNRLGAQIQVFTSGSDGSDGALNITAPGVTYFDPVALKINPKGDNIFNFTTINIAANSILKISEVKVHGPVYFLASGDVTIAGVIDISGDNSPGTTATAAEQIPAFAGSGGYSGGLGGVHGDANHQALPGNGPGGGAAGDINASSTYAVGGTFTTNRFLVPLVGGSGGGGTNDNSQYGAQGGAGGGAILIASSTKITLVSNDSAAPDGYQNGSVAARGGYGGSRGCGGAGGAVRLVSNTITWTNDFSSIYVEGNGGQNAAGACKVFPQSGFIRLEGNTVHSIDHIGLNGPFVVSLPFALNLPTAPPPVIKVDSISGVTINANPFSFPDTTINTGSPVPVVIKATNLPTGATVTLYLLSDTAANQAIPVTLAGTTQTSSGTVNVTFPSGGTRGFVKASWATLGTQSH